MAQKLKLRELGMDTMERLYYERKETRQKAYTARRKQSTMKKEKAYKRNRKEQDADNFDIALGKAI